MILSFFFEICCYSSFLKEKIINAQVLESLTYMGEFGGTPFMVETVVVTRYEP